MIKFDKRIKWDNISDKMGDSDENDKSAAKNTSMLRRHLALCSTKEAAATGEMLYPKSNI